MRDRDMIKAGRFAIAIGTLTCAFGIGYVMQSMAEPTPETAAETRLTLTDVQHTAAIPVPPEGAPQPAGLPPEPVKLTAVAVEPMRGSLPSEEPSPAFGCDLDMSAEPAPAAMVRLDLSAPCMVRQRFTLHHNGMMFSAVTDEAGQSRVIVPALSEQAIFIASFANGDGAMANTQVSGLDAYDRVVVQWIGQSGLELHAREFGAGYGESGHVWSGAPRSTSAATKAEGGFLVRLGARDLELARKADVYTFPSGTVSRAGDVALSIEAEVTKDNCGRDVEAQSIQLPAGGRPVAQDLTLAIPDCAAVGDFLVLKNMLDDLKIARN